MLITFSIIFTVIVCECVCVLIKPLNGNHCDVDLWSWTRLNVNRYHDYRYHGNRDRGNSFQVTMLLKHGYSHVKKCIIFKILGVSGSQSYQPFYIPFHLTNSLDLIIYIVSEMY